jgi:exosortase
LSAITPNTALGYGTSADARRGGPGSADRAGGELGPFGLSKAAWIKIGVISGLLLAIFWPNLRRLWSKTHPFSDQPDAANWQHAFFVPLIGLYYLYANREQLLGAPVRSRRLGESRYGSVWRSVGLMFLAVWVLPAVLLLALGLHHSALGVQALFVITLAFANTVLTLFVPSQKLGFLILLEGLAISMYGIHPGHNDFVWDFGMVVTVFGVVLMLSGWDVMKTAWFPIAFLVCALPWPGLVYSWVAGPLQMLAAKAAVVMLRFTGVEAWRVGTKIVMFGHNNALRALNVAEACAGLRSLMTFITVAAAVAFLSARPLWQKAIITFSAVPVAIFCNVMRVAGQGILDYHKGYEWSQGFAHQFAGVVMLIPAFFLIMAVGWVLDHLFLEEVDDKEKLIVRAARARTAAAGVVAGTGVVPAAGPTAIPRPASAGPRQPAARPIAGRIGPAQAKPGGGLPPQVPPQQRRDQ